jgi:hypothetical protein
MVFDRWSYFLYYRYRRWQPGQVCFLPEMPFNIIWSFPLIQQFLQNELLSLEARADSAVTMNMANWKLP